MYIQLKIADLIDNTIYILQNASYPLEAKLKSICCTTNNLSEQDSVNEFIKRLEKRPKYAFITIEKVFKYQTRNKFIRVISFSINKDNMHLSFFITKHNPYKRYLDHK